MYSLTILCGLFFLIWKLGVSSVDLKKSIFFLIFSKMNQIFVNVQKGYQMQKKKQCSIFKIATCEAFLKNTKILNFSKKKKKSKTMHHRKNMNKKVLESLFTSLYGSYQIYES